MRTARLGAAIGGVVVSLSLGCSSQNFSLRMRPVVEPFDESSVLPELAEKKRSKLLVIPPLGVARESFDNVLGLFEAELIDAGLTPVSPLKAGIVVEKSGTDDRSEKGIVKSAVLSDSKEAFAFAKQSQADAIIEISRFEWSSKATPSRFFIVENPESYEFREVSLAKYEKWTGWKHSYASLMLTLNARVLDVETSHVLGTFTIRCAANWNLPTEYVAQLTQTKDKWVVVDENFKYSDPWWVSQAKKDGEKRVVQLVTGRLPR